MEANVFGTWQERGKTPIGIDLGTRAVRAVQLTWTKNRWQVIAAGASGIPMDLAVGSVDHAKAQAQALVDVLENTSFSGKHAVTSLPSSVLQVKNLRLPPMPPNELKAAVEWEASDRLKLGSDYRIQFFDAGEVRQGEELRQEIILLAVPQKALDQHIALMNACNLKLEAVDVDATALSNMAQVCGKGGSESVQLVVDLGTTGTNVLITRQGRVMFFKRSDIGGRQFEDAIATKFNISPSEASQVLARRTSGDSGESPIVGNSRREHTAAAIEDAVRPLMTELCKDIGRCLRYQGVTFRGQRATEVLLAGGGAVDPLLVDTLTKEVGIEARKLDPARHMDWSGVSESLLALNPPDCWAVAAGLALRFARLGAVKEAA